MEYILITTISLICLKIGIKNKIKSIYFLGMLVAILFCGLREGIGKDFYIDKNIFEKSIQSKGYLIYFVVNFLKSIKLNYSSYFLFMAFVNITLVFLLIRNNIRSKINKRKEYRSWLIYFWDMAYISSFNVMRQGVANFIFLLILKLEKRKILLILLFILGIGFHKSFIITIIFLFLSECKYNKKFFITMLIIAIISSNIFDLQTFFIENILSNIGYYGKIYSRKENFGNVLRGGGIGLGYYYRFFVISFLIYFYDEIKKENPKELKFVNLSIFWCILKIFTYKIWIIERVLDYLYYSTLISFPILFQKIEKQKYGKYIVIIILTGFFILFLKSTIFSDLTQNLIPYKSILNFDEKFDK